jgi:hypothetical protein
MGVRITVEMIREIRNGSRIKKTSREVRFKRKEQRVGVCARLAPASSATMTDNNIGLSAFPVPAVTGWRRCKVRRAQSSWRHLKENQCKSNCLFHAP